jgi:hypothetical protein
MLQLDCQKAYDRVEHIYTWEIMSALGSNSKFVSLIKGLVSNGAAKVQYNGLFTGKYLLKGGVVKAAL